MADLRLGGFWSYVHFDDNYERGRIGRLRERLEQSIHFHLGDTSFKIFRDKDEIGWGQKWEERIETSLGEALMLFPIVTPSFFGSKACKGELKSFKERQNKLKRDDLILPIYYLSTDLFEGIESGVEPADVEIAQYLKTHQYEDFRSLRASEETDPAYFQAIERLGMRAVEVLKRIKSGTATSSITVATPKTDSNGEAEKRTGPESEAGKGSKLLPGHILSLTVNQMPGRGDVTSISEAIARAPGGARILVSPGHYREALVIEKPLELIGNGNVEDVVIEADEGDTIKFDTNIGLIRNLTIRQTGEYKESDKTTDNAVYIKQGRLELEDCRLTSKNGSCIHITNESDPRIRRNRIYDSYRSGILITGRARGTYEDNEFFRCRWNGILVRKNASVIFRRNRSYENGRRGLDADGNSTGVFEDNEFFENGGNGIWVNESANPIIRRCKIYANHQSGIKVSDSGQGTYEDSDIYGNRGAGILIDDSAVAVIRRNRITSNEFEAIWIRPNGGGTISDNDLTGNERGSWDIDASGTGTIVDERNKVDPA